MSFLGYDLNFIFMLVNIEMYLEEDFKVGEWKKFFILGWFFKSCLGLFNEEVFSELISKLEN